ncbi:MAG: ribosomal RNA small subunit methyltransferase D [Gammaproteobacteria bacterium]|nr:MAG: ribosomal RNA small subunit methyltransferase D [Gammaproteobacteria bacterium]|tara:strand:- start:418 stop:969 length:552 start_codon:yes stop_codon:yes gene_type:complete
MSQLRIIAGKYKGRRISFNPNSSLRPSTNRSKETLFNWLMMNIEGSKCLDMFAGTGSLGIEAISRGAEFVVFCEKNKKNYLNIKKNITTLDCSKSTKILNIDSLLHTKEISGGPFDIVFLDPPFRRNLIQLSLRKLESQVLIKADTLVYVEREKENVEIPDGWNEIKNKTEGNKRYSLLAKNG